MEANLQRRIQRYGWDRAVAIYEQSWAEQLTTRAAAPARDGGTAAR